MSTDWHIYAGGRPGCRPPRPSAIYARRPAGLLLGLIAGGGAAFAGPGGVSAQLPAFPAERAARSAAVDSLFAEAVDTGGPGCAVSVDLAGDVLHLAGYGLASLEWQRPIDGNTVFDLASLSKQFTAAAALLLAERGRLSLDADVRAFLPEIPAYDAPITVRHLIHHTSGLRDYFSLYGLAGRFVTDQVPERGLSAMIARQRATNFPVGTRYGYSNTNYVLLARIVERASGRPFGRFVEEELFAPAGMGDSRVLDDHGAVIPRLASSYAEDEEGELRKRLLMTDVVGHEGVYSTAADLARWNAALATRSIGGRAFVDTLFTPGSAGDGDPFYAFGLRRFSRRGAVEISHGGTMGGFRTYYRHYPATGLGVAVLCNQLEYSPFQFSRAVADLYLGDLLEAAQPTSDARGGPAPFEPVTLATEWLRRFEGAYFSAELDAHHVIRSDGEALLIEAGEADAERAEAVDSTTFRAGGLTWHFRLDGDSVVGFEVATGRASGITFRRTPSASAPATSPGVGAGAPQEAGVPVELRYLGTSGWRVVTPRHVLLFDWVEGDPALDDRLTDGRSLTLFVSHGHADHASDSSIAAVASRPDARVVMGWDGPEAERRTVIGPREVRTIDGLIVRTIASTDAGVGFLVEADGVRVFHAGDHAQWSAAFQAAYRAEIDWLERTAGAVDVALLPVATGAQCEPHEHLFDGASYALRVLRARVAAPMHVRCPDRLEVYEQFRAHARNAGVAARIFVPTRLHEEVRLRLGAGPPGGEGAAHPGGERAGGSLSAHPLLERAFDALFDFDFDLAERRSRETIPVGGLPARLGVVLSRVRPLAGRIPEDAAEALLEIGPDPASRERRAAGTRELDYLKAVEGLVLGPNEPPERFLLFAEAMRVIASRYPSDADAASFAAMGFLGAAGGRRDEGLYARVADEARSALQRDPAHHGGLHYLIHALDHPDRAHLALQAARAYAAVAGASAHAAHMPSHIFLPLGLWRDVEAANRRSWRASTQAVARGDAAEPDDHAARWLSYALLQQGESDAAAVWLDSLSSSALWPDGRPWFRIALARADHVASGTPESLEALGATPRPAPDSLGLTGAATVFWTDGVLAFRTGDLPALDASLRALEGIRREWARDGGTADFPDQLLAQLRALRAGANADWDAAIAELRTAALLEADRPYGFDPPNPALPSAELLGHALLCVARSSEAAEWFHLALRRDPGRLAAEAGLRRALGQAAAPTGERTVSDAGPTEADPWECDGEIRDGRPDD